MKTLQDAEKLIILNNLFLRYFKLLLSFLSLIDTTAGTPALNTTPIFKVVQQRRGQNVVMVLDKSGSMNTYDVSTKTKLNHEMFET